MNNQMQFLDIFKHPKYVEFINGYPELQNYWNAPMYLVERKSDGYKEVCSNIQIGDFFGCDKTSQVGIVYKKITHIQVSTPKERQKPSPQKQGGNYLSYYIGGDIGGHWNNPDHDEFIKSKHFIWLPTPERLFFAQFINLGNILHSLLGNINYLLELPNE